MMPAMLKRNISLTLSRQVRGGVDWRHALVGELLLEHTYVSNRTSEIGYCFPLYAIDSSENLNSEFRAFLDGRYGRHFTPEEVLGYLYAVLHAPSYRMRYAEFFLRIDFPRIPFTERRKDFDALSALGWQLAQAHLLRDVPRKKFAQFHGKGDRTVEHVRYASADQSISINASQSFAPVPQNVWEFFIGGYQVLDKYLKSRKARVLSLDEINHVSAVADSLAFTIDQMAKIDKAYGKAFRDS